MDYEQIAGKLNEFSAKNVQGVMALTEKSLERSHKLAEISFDTTKSLLEEANDTLSKVLNAKDPQAVISIAQENGLDGITSKLAAHQQSVTKIVREAAEEMTAMSDASMDQMKSTLKEWVETMTANAPAGSDAFVNAFKTSIDTALQSLGQVQAATKEVLNKVEKSTEEAVEAIQGQVANVKKVAAKTTARPAARKTA